MRSNSLNNNAMSAKKKCLGEAADSVQLRGGVGQTNKGGAGEYAPAARH